MMKKTVIGLHLILAAVLTTHLFSLWQGLNRRPHLKEEKNPVALNYTTLMFKPAARTRYPRLFDVQIPPPSHEEKDTKKDKPAGSAAKQVVKEMIETPEGMRLRAVFTSLDQRVALVEPEKKKSGPLLEVRETDVVQGYRVQTVAAGYINLLRKKDQTALKLVIFDLENDKTNQSE